MDYIRASNARSLPVHLVLLGFNLSGEDNLSLEEVNATSNGFLFTDQLDAPTTDVPLEFPFRPLVAMVSIYADRLQQRALQLGNATLDGSISGCDVIMQKPWNAARVNVLLDYAAV